QLDLRLFVARLPEGQDPAGLLVDSTTPSLENIIAQAVPIEHHLIDQIMLAHNLDEPEAMARAIHAAGEVIRWAGDPDIRGAAMEYLAARVGRDQALVHAYVDQRFHPGTLQRDRGDTRSLA
ncbi:MAG: hypothetical protein ACC652_15400, partial [Acidimicrobiales bacterium]